MMRQWWLCLLVCACIGAGEPFADTPEDWERVLRQVQADVDALRALEGKRPAIEAAQAAGAPVLPVAAQGADQIRAELAQMQSDMLGRDVIQDMVQTSLVPGGGLDPTASMTYDVGPGGLLWAFWATDAPGTDLIANQLARVQAAYPEMRVHDLHIMRLTDWYNLVKALSQLKDQLEAHDPLANPAQELRRKQDIVAMRMPRYYATTQMAKTRRQGGFLLIEDMTAALAWSVREIPCFVYVSPQGVAHRIKGLNPDRDLTAWIAQCLLWERENMGIIQERLRAGP